MRRGSGPLACLLGALLTLSLCGSAHARGEPRIVNGTPASPGEYPAQGVLRFDGDFICGGTLVSNRHFLTAGHCVVDNNDDPFAVSHFSVTLGNVDRDAGQDFTFSNLELNAGYVVVNDAPENDSALFTLSSPAPTSLEPMRLIAPDETSLWAPGRTATLVGWGRTFTGGPDSDVLRETTAPMRSDDDCSAVTAYGSDFHPATMVCAGNGSSDTCQGDSGGPLMVSDGSFLALAGLTSWGGPCASPTQPGVYTRLGATALNDWVRDRVPMARATVSDGAPDPGQSVSFQATATHPGIPGYFTNLAWDFESDGVTDAQGANPSHAYPTAGTYVARVTATGAGPDTAVAKVAVRVSQPAAAATPTPVAPVTTATPPQTEPIPRARLATILALSRPTVRRGRFSIRLNFDQAAPSGIAVVEVFRAKKKIGGARVRVRRGDSRRVTVKLTKAGNRLLRRSSTKRLRVKIQVRVKRQVLRSKTVTLRR